MKLKRQRKPGTIEDALLIQWRALSAAQTALYAAAEVRDVLSAVHAITQASSGYAKLMESHQLEERVAAIEEAVAARQNQPQTARPYGAAFA